MNQQHDWKILEMDQSFEKSSQRIFFQGAIAASKCIYYWLTVISVQKLSKVLPVHFHLSWLAVISYSLIQP